MSNRIPYPPGAAFEHAEEVQVQEESVLSQAADAVETSMHALESAVSSVAASLVPSAAMVESVMPSAASLPELDLTLPTASSSDAAQGKAC